MTTQLNVYGKPLIPCCMSPMTGFYRTGYCETNLEDQGKHIVCAVMTDEFLTFSKAQGNDLSTPRPEYDFPGLVAGDKWCLCLLRWKEAYDHGCAPQVILDATHQKALTVVSLKVLSEFAV